ncbi:MAG TPA: hypothetical protein VEQ11_04210 [Chloroflexota bacterium]|nr:hypothetical protein [Chloroflexota bacterium]
MHFELWDTRSRNLVEDFESESDALAAAHELIGLNAPSYPGALALARHNDDGTTTWLAIGDALAKRAVHAKRRRKSA